MRRCISIAGPTIAVAISVKRMIWSGMRMTVLSRPDLNLEEADQFPSSDDVSPEPEQGQCYLRVTECVI